MRSLRLLVASSSRNYRLFSHDSLFLSIDISQSQHLSTSHGLRTPNKSIFSNILGIGQIGRISCEVFSTGKSLSEALIFASTNSQYDDRLFIELQVQYMKIPSSNLGRTCCVQKLFLTFRTIFVHNMFCKKKSFWQIFTCFRITD